MTIIRDYQLNLETKQVLRREGIRRHGSVKPEIINLIDELLVTIKDNHLLEPTVAFETHIITEIDQSKLSLTNVNLHSPLFASSMLNAKELAVVLCTIGPRLEHKVTEYLGKNEPLRGILLDGIGSAAVDLLTQEICRHIAGIASTRGYQASSPLSPGTSNFPITEQKQLFQLVPSEQIGVRLSGSGIMVPRKSTSMVIGIGQGMKVRVQEEVCAHCNLSRTCLYRYGK